MVESSLNVNLVENTSSSSSSSSQQANISDRIRDPDSFAVHTFQPSFLPPVFHYQVPERKRFVLVLDRSSAMGLNNRWSLLHGQLFRFISSLPDNAEVAVVTFGRRAELVLKPTALTGENREGVYGRIPRRHLEDDATCLDCAIRLATRTLSKGGRGGGRIVLITATKTRPNAFNQLLQSIGEGSHQVQMITFEESTFYDVRHMGQFGKTFIVHENSHDVLTSAINISDIFTSVLRESADIQMQKFHHELKMTDDSNTVSGNFVVEESLRRNLWVEISSPEQDDIEYFELTNPTGKVFQFPKFEHQLVYFRLEGLQEPGIWSYKASLFEKVQYSRVSISALGQPSNEDWARLETWTSVGHQGVNALETPVVIYARLTRHNSPVINASLVATVHRPGAEAVTIALRDSGSGYPDITAGDGVYSAYFTQFSSEPGFYSVVMTASNSEGQASLPRVSQTEESESQSQACCGSSLPFSFTVPTTPFTRHDLSGSFFVQEGSQFYLRQGSPQRNDVYPPSRVTDFSLAEYLDNSLYVTLTWTAPGNDYDFGKAFRYEIRCYTNREALREENFTDMGILVHTSLIPVPEEYGAEQRSTVGIPWPNEVFYYAIVAYDEEGNRGQVSNVVSVFAEEKPSTPNPHIGFDQAILENEAYPRHESLPLTSANSDTLIYIVSGVISALLVVILLIVVPTLLRSQWTKQSKHSPSSSSPSQLYAAEYDSSLVGTLKKVASLPDITKDNAGTETKTWRDDSSCDKDSIDKSPIPSISDNLSWKYLTAPNRASGQEVPGVHRVHTSQTYQPSSTDSSMFSNDSETTASAEFVLGPTPRISIMEDYSVYRDLSHLDSLTLNTTEYFNISHLPKELQGLTIVPYSPGYDTMESHKRRHVSLV